MPAQAAIVGGVAVVITQRSYYGRKGIVIGIDNVVRYVNGEADEVGRVPGQTLILRIDLHVKGVRYTGVLAPSETWEPQE